MAINAYTGLMGHGKTSQVVERVVVPKYKDGYNIVTNISGLNEEEIRKYILKKWPDYNPENFGTIRMFNGDEPIKENFFPTEIEIDEIDPITNKKKTKVLDDGFVKAGDLIIVDEAWQFWDNGFKFPKNHIRFFRYMRHFVNSKGHTSDLVIVTQDHTTLDKQLKALIETLVVTVKPKNLSEGHFIVTIYQGNKTTKSAMLSHSLPKKFNTEIFPLYKSYSAENAKESFIDGRISFWKSSQLRNSIIAFFILMGIGSYVIYNYYMGFANKAKERQEQLKSKEQDKGKVTQDNKSQDGKPPHSSSAPAPIFGKNNESFRIITGVVTSSNRFIVYVKDQTNKVRAHNNPVCHGSGQFIACKIDNEFITYYK